MRCLLIKFRAVRIGNVRHVARVLDRRTLHAETDSEEWNLVLARILNRVNHSLNAALPESTRHKDAIITMQSFGGDLRRSNFFGFDPINHRFVIVRQPAVQQSLAQTLVCVL